MKKPNWGIRIVCLLLCFGALFTLTVPAAAAADVPVDEPRNAAAVHAAADTDSAVIGYFQKGTPLTVLADAGDFYRVDCYDMIGYIAKSLVACTEGEYSVGFGADAGDTFRLSAGGICGALSARLTVYQTALCLQGIPYVAAGSSTRGFDCSGLTQYVMRYVGIELKRTCGGQLSQGVIISKDALQCGDLVFFQNTTSGSVFTSHVGIYIGGGRLLHAGTKGVCVAYLDDEYYVEHYLCARRYILTDGLGAGVVSCALGAGYEGIASLGTGVTRCVPSGIAD